MGMFDYVKGLDKKCPVCGYGLDTFQTKSLRCMMTTYEIGDKVPEKLSLEEDIEVGEEIEIHNACFGCGSYISYLLGIDDEGKLVPETELQYFTTSVGDTEVGVEASGEPPQFYYDTDDYVVMSNEDFQKGKEMRSPRCSECGSGFTSECDSDEDYECLICGSKFEVTSEAE